MMHRIEETIDRNICIGCGACAAATGGAIQLSLGPTRLYQPDITDVPQELLRAASRVCPFSDESPNEDELRAPNGDEKMIKDPYLGQVSNTFAGRVSDDGYAMGSSSGGLASWLIEKLIAEGHVDAAISVGRSGGDDSIFDYSVIEPSGVVDNRKSHYYAATMADALLRIEQTNRRYVLIGVPCFIRAARALRREKELYRDRIPLLVALVCGHYKTQAFAESLAWQLGVSPDRLADADFRVKSPERRANDYDFAARDSTSGEWRRAPVRDLVGGNWGHSAFQPEACNFCDDVVGETADVSFGDAWLPQFTPDPRGTNVVVSRNRMVDDLFSRGVAAGEIRSFPATAADVVASQAGGFRHRRDGLSVRLADDMSTGLSVPAKRVSAESAVDVRPRRAELYRQRRKMAAGSHVAFQAAVAADDLRVYLRAQRREMDRYRRIEYKAPQRFKLLCRRVARLLLKEPIRFLSRRTRGEVRNG
jgi:coenzyme F420-reducing hydrogenase beta subunit